MPGKVVARQAVPHRAMFARIAFPNGEQVMVSMTQKEVALLQMRFFGIVPTKKLCCLDPAFLVFRWNMMEGYTADSRTVAILDHLTEAVSSCNNAEAAKGMFDLLKAGELDAKEADPAGQ